MTKSQSGFVFLTTFLTVFRISFNFSGVMSEMVRYSFCQNFNSICVYAQLCYKLFVYQNIFFLSQFLGTVLSLWNSVVCYVHQHIWIEVMLCLTVLQIVFH